MNPLLLLFVVLAAGVTLSNRYLTFFFHPIDQNFYRFAAGSILLLLLVLRRSGRLDGLLRSPRDLSLTVGCGALIAGVMVLSIAGLRGISAATAAMLSVAGMPLTVGLAMLVYRDERCARPGWFAWGIAALGLVTLGYGWASTGDRGGGVDHLWGIGLFSLALVLKAGLALILKSVLRRRNSLAVAGVSAPATTLVLAVSAVLLAEPGIPAPQIHGPLPALVLLGSGAIGIWAGVALHNHLVWSVGLVPVQLTTAAVPPIVAVAGYVLLGEAVSPLQMLFGLIMLACVAWLVRLKQHKPAIPATRPAGAVAPGPGP